MNKKILGLQLFEWLVFALVFLLLTLFMRPDILSSIEQGIEAAVGFPVTLDHLLYIGLYALFIVPMLICVYAFSLRWGTSIPAKVARFLACLIAVAFMVFLGLLFQTL